MCETRYSSLFMGSFLVIARIPLLVFTLFTLGGCPDQVQVDAVLGIPSVSRVVEDSSGQKFIVYIDSKNLLTVSSWNTVTNKWESKTSVDMPNFYPEAIFLDMNNITAQSVYMYGNSLSKELVTLNLANHSVSTRQFTDNYRIVSGDEFIVYNGLNVQSHQLSTDVLSNLHVLPSIPMISAGLNLNINSVKFQMICTPENAYQWDRKTHYCIIANAFDYPQPNVNEFYEINTTVNAGGNYVYRLLKQGSYNMSNVNDTGIFPLVEDRFMPIQPSGAFSSVIQVNPDTPQKSETYTIDSQGNLHLFYVLKDDPNIYYEYYTLSNPTTPHYLQVLR